MRILLITMPEDYHSEALRWSLASRGHDVVPFFPADYPTRQTVSLKVEVGVGASVAVENIANGPAYPDQNFDVAIVRRNPRAVVDRDLHPSDRLFAQSESQCVLDAAPEFFDVKGLWLNPLESNRVARSKPIQLKYALQLGLHVPNTLISNDPDEVLKFSKQSPEGVAAKAFYTANWKNNDRRKHYSIFTAKVSHEELLLRREQIGLCPMIYQEYVAKRHELRVVMFGGSYIAAKIDSQQQAETSVDWRKEQLVGLEASVSRTYLPRDVVMKCRALMNRLGIHFGIFDFVVTPDGDFVFLEVNEMGQWLYLEESSEDFPLLSAMTDFIESNDPDFVWSENPDSDIAYNQFIESKHLKMCVDHLWPQHVQPETRFNYIEN